MELTTRRLKLIPCTEDSLSKIYAAEDYEPGPHIDMYLEELQRDPSLLGWGVWIVIDKKSNVVIGDMGFKGGPNSEYAVEIGYGIVPSRRGKGYATEAAMALVEWAFTSEDVKKIVAECLEDNIASIRVLEKLQMKRIGAEGNILEWELERPMKPIED